MPAASAISCVVACNLPSAKKTRFAVSLISFSVPVSRIAICLTNLSNIFEIKKFATKIGVFGYVSIYIHQRKVVKFKPYLCMSPRPDVYRFIFRL